MGTNPAHNSTLSRHRLSSSEVDLLASGQHDDAILAILRKAERSRRRLLLRLVLHHARDRPVVVGPLPSVDEAWTLLVHAERAAPEPVSEMLAHPQIGVWGAHTLRRLRGRADESTPVWVHVGQLHTMACAAALLAGLDFRMTVPLWDGAVVLPAIGRIQLSTTNEWSTADVVQDAAGARVENTSATAGIGHLANGRWFPRQMVRCGPDDNDVHLDDVGPYRGLNLPTQAEPLAASDTKRWEALVAQAWHLLRTDYSAWEQELSAGLAVIVPRPKSFRFRPHSASVGDGFGAAIVAEPHDAAQLAMTLVHEFQHSKLNAVNHLVPLAEANFSLDHYSPWRDDPRPVMGLYQGLYAFTSVAEFWLTRCGTTTGRERELTLFELALLRPQLNTALEDLHSARNLTEEGRRFVEGVGRRVAALRAVELPRDLVKAAEAAAIDHRLGWRVSHLQPNAQLVRLAADAWLRGRSAPALQGEPRVLANHQSRRLDVKAVLSRVRISSPGEFARARSQLGGSAQAVADAGEGDLALVSGDPSQARGLYLRELSTAAGRPGAWSGLALAVDMLAPGCGATMLVRQPELVSAVHRRITATASVAPHPEELAEWLGQAG